MALSLLDTARDVREAAYAPYSRFKVGAAIRGASGMVYRGCNVENVAYPEGTCARPARLPPWSPPVKPRWSRWP